MAGGDARARARRLFEESARLPRAGDCDRLPLFVSPLLSLWIASELLTSLAFLELSSSAATLASWSMRSVECDRTAVSVPPSFQRAHRHLVHTCCPVKLSLLPSMLPTSAAPFGYLPLTVPLTNPSTYHIRQRARHSSQAAALPRRLTGPRPRRRFRTIAAGDADGLL